jgi:murein L,D-transpeptidase YafK
MVSVALSAAIALSGCYTDGTQLPINGKAMQPLSQKMVEEIESKEMDKESPILIRLYKEESELEVWKQTRSGQYALLKTYPICRWSGELGPKVKEGDRQAPEGFYNITPGQMNPNSAYYLSFDLGYPNAFDRSYGRTGSQLMVHGDCSSRGCYSMTDEQISEIYALGRDSFFGGQKSFQVQAYPFHMTAENMAKHRNNPNIAFWKMLKKGSDHFEVSHLEPKVNVCEKRYVFDAQAPGGTGRPLAFSPSGKCPAFEVSNEIASAVHDKEQQDDTQIADLTRRNIATAPIKTNADGGMHPVFVAAVKRNQLGVAPQEGLFVSTAPGTIPPTVRPPRIEELAGAPAMDGAAPAQPTMTTTQMAIAEPESSKPTAVSSFFGNLFGSSKPDTPPVKTAEKKPDKKSAEKKPLLDRMAKMVGLGKSEPAKHEAKPATRVAAHGAVKPKTDSRIEAKVEAKATPAPQAADAASQSVFPDVKPVAAARPAPSMNGSAAVVPTGSFDNRWGALR